MFIPESKLESFKAELAKLNKKLAKYESSIETLSLKKSYRVVGYDNRLYYLDAEFIDDNNKYLRISGFDVELSNPIAKGKQGVQYLGCMLIVNGVGQLHAEQENALNAVNKEHKDVCDHCGKNMKRNNWYFFLEDDKVKKIGSTCVKEWFGMDIESILAKYEEFMIYVNSYESDEEFENARANDSIFSIENILRSLATVTDGFKLSWQKRSDYTLGTATEIKMMLLDSKSKTVEVDVEQIKAIVLEKWNIEASNDFEFNIIEALFNNGKVADMISVKHLGVVCWAIWNAMTTIKKTNNNISSEYLGEVGDKIEFTATPKCVFSGEGHYGITYIYIFETDKGIAKWTTSKAIDVEKESTFKGTIKETIEYNGQKQTVVTRCKQAE